MKRKVKKAIDYEVGFTFEYIETKVGYDVHLTPKISEADKERWELHLKQMREFYDE